MWSDLLWALEHTFHVPLYILRIIEFYLTIPDERLLIGDAYGVAALIKAISSDKRDRVSVLYEEENSNRVLSANGQRLIGNEACCNLQYTSDKATNVVAALGRFIPNVEGPPPCKLRLLMSWTNMFTETGSFAARNLRIASAYRSGSEPAEIYRLTTKVDRDTAAKDERDCSFDWQHWLCDWEAESRERWTPRLIPTFNNGWQRGEIRRSTHFSNATGDVCGGLLSLLRSASRSLREHYCAD
ncbi:hypothetical protein J6590_073939 [Homalodisca vitripennis]|nr:hypothetical protein J6590_073939 [Homalodisca vitripennis]